MFPMILGVGEESNELPSSSEGEHGERASAGFQGNPPQLWDGKQRMPFLSQISGEGFA